MNVIIINLRLQTKYLLKYNTVGNSLGFLVPMSWTIKVTDNKHLIRLL